MSCESIQVSASVREYDFEETQLDAFSLGYAKGISLEDTGVGKVI